MNDNDTPPPAAPPEADNADPAGCEKRLVVPLRVLKLTLKKQWFDMIASGEKKEEYRTPGKWILSRLEGKSYDRIELKNGYGPNVPTMEVEYLGWNYSFGKRKWGGGAETGKPLVTIHLGRVIFLHNAPPTRATD